MNPDKDLPVWAIDSSDYVINDRYLKLRRDSCTTPHGGKVDAYYVLELKDWVNCIAIDSDDNVMMLRHYRHGVQKYLMEFIGGGMEEGESPEEAVRREVKEETGYTDGLIFHVGTSYPNPANHTNKVHTFLVVGGKMSQNQNLEVGETLHVEKIPFKTVIEEMSKSDSVYPAIYLAALFHVMNFIRSSNDPALQHLKKYV
ncbi:NUDIX hydrolase [Streptomyces caniscabiei]|uniref:NUDIX hydrolase n=1 Tax=Streptomyces caniscabiei TaxID=2746961 RepID=UPI0029B7348C|nr:NUDIX hydrolase [Streptomyces caniscabiei]MDX2775785.1 NUDIX hydrolase [Streptomyces caniscabiei]